MRSVFCFLVSVFIVTSAWAQTPSATTQLGSVTKGTNKTFTFTPAAFGQVTATLSWDTQGARLFMIMVCGSADPQTYVIVAGLLDRFARFESGVIGGEPCALAVATADQTANFRLHVVRSGDQFITSAATSGFVALTEAREGALISDEAVRAVSRVRRLLR